MRYESVVFNGKRVKAISDYGDGTFGVQYEDGSVDRVDANGLSVYTVSEPERYQAEHDIADTRNPLNTAAITAVSALAFIGVAFTAYKLLHAIWPENVPPLTVDEQQKLTVLGIRWYKTAGNSCDPHSCPNSDSDATTIHLQETLTTERAFALMRAGYAFASTATPNPAAK
jgi:hypothetical protein